MMTKAISVSLTAKQLEAIERATEKSGLISVSAWCRYVILKNNTLLDDVNCKGGVKP